MATLQEILNNVQSARTSVGKFLFGDQIPFTEKLSTVDKRLRQRPGAFTEPETLRTITDLALGFSPAGAAKVFKQGPSTLEGLISLLSRTGDKLPPRSGLRAAVQHPATKEIFAGDVGGLHPVTLAQQVLTRRKQPLPGTLKFGFQIPEAGSPFIPEVLASALQKGQAAVIQKLLDKGISMDIILDTLKKGTLE